MAADLWYTIRQNRYRSGCLSGFTVEEDGTLRTEEQSAVHSLFLKGIDGVHPGATWGRLSVRLSIAEDMVCYFYAAATDDPDLSNSEGNTVTVDFLMTDPARSAEDKIRFLKSIGAKRFVNLEEALLYGLQGRYLYLACEITGKGAASIRLLRVSARGDNFMNAFPEIYRERGGFLHRYLSIFSTIYNDIGADGEGMYRILDIEHCKAPLLEMYASWFGIDLQGGFLSEETMRAIVREAYQLNRMKGTRRALLRILELVLGEQVLIIEQSAATARRDEEEDEEEEHDTDGVYDVTVLINTRLTEERRHQLIWLLDQFKPIRARIRLMQLSGDAVMDGNSYLDMNARIPEAMNPILDEQTLYDGAVTLL